jgi:hypothetical protein
MNNKCDYSSFLNEFNYSINRKFFLIPQYNGYIKSENYKKYLQQTIDRFRHDVLYVLPFNSDGKPGVFLKNLHTELSKKQAILTRYKKRIIEKDYSYSKPIIRHIKDNVTKQSKRRIALMQNKQLLILNKALAITEQAIESFSFTIISKETTPDNRPETEPETEPEMVWDGGKLGLIQLIKSMIRSKIILIGRLSENEVVVQIATAMNIDITDDNFSSYSRAIHSSKNDYQPQIFKDILNAYEILVFEKREKRERQ